MSQWAIVDGKRYDVEKCTDLEISTREEHGNKITGVYLTRGGKVLVSTYSIWERGNTGTCIGRGWHIAGAEEIAQLAARFEHPALVELVPEAEGWVAR